jgi:hypothetical protein
LAGLVVPSDKSYAIGVADFEAQEEKERFERVETTIDKITYVWLEISSDEKTYSNIPMNK